MKIAFNLLLVFVCVFAIEAQESQDEYDDIFEFDKLVNNPRGLMKSYIECLLDKGPCTRSTTYLKADIPKGLKENCAFCTARDKNLLRKAIKYVMENYPNDWELLKKHFDPTGEYKENIKKLLDGQN